ncbi:MAG TPA: helix-turn-helix domain-containing protein [Solirubrobacteraceae bacterium]|nr:helix-turn-helix domain-containing protein [Solirubrobacteraceae bacterium]
MVRWRPNAQSRLAQAALDLYEEQGFENTTVAEIAARAGLTERTFFRHFADKREVLFAGGEFQESIIAGVTGAPESASPIEAATAGLDAAGALLEDRHEFAIRRQRVIAASPDLREREVMKLAAVATALAGALRTRGVAEPAATLTGEVAMSVFRNAFERWVDQASAGDLRELIRESLNELRTLAGS